jgi:hypothetical protein
MKIYNYQKSLFIKLNIREYLYVQINPFFKKMSVDCKRKIDTIQSEIEILERHAAKSPVLPYGYKQGLDDLSERLKNVQQMLKFGEQCPSLNRDVWTVVLPYLQSNVRSIKALRRTCKQLRNVAMPLITDVYFSRYNFKKARSLVQFKEHGQQFLEQLFVVFPNTKHITIDMCFLRLFAAEVVQTFFDNAPQSLHLCLNEGPIHYRAAKHRDIDLHHRHTIDPVHRYAVNEYFLI